LIRAFAEFNLKTEFSMPGCPGWGDFSTGSPCGSYGSFPPRLSCLQLLKLPVTGPLMANTPVINLRRGQAVRHNNDVCIITDMEHKTPPRMASYVQMSIRSITSGRVHNLRLTSNESLDGVNLTKVDHEYSYKDSSGYHFLHPETYEDVIVEDALIKPVKDYLMEGQKYVLVFTDDTIASIDLPASMVLTVAEAPEGVKGDSSTNVFKTAIMQTGLAVQVPLFIGPGEKISVKTEDGSYLGRA
jgi:elongation factor P